MKREKPNTICCPVTLALESMKQRSADLASARKALVDALLDAASHGRWSSVGIYIDSTTQDAALNGDLLCYALWNRNVDAITFLTQRAADVTRARKALLDCARDGYWDGVSACIGNITTRQNIALNRELFGYACKAGRLEMVEFFRLRGVNAISASFLTLGDAPYSAWISRLQDDKQSVALEKTRKSSNFFQADADARQIPHQKPVVARESAPALPVARSA